MPVYAFVKFPITTGLCVALFTLTAGASTPKIDSLEALLLKHERQDTAKVNLLNDLAYEIRLNDPQKAKSYAQKSLELSSRLNYPKGKAASLWLQGVTTLRGDKQAALESFRQSLKIAEEIDDREVQCNCLIAIGNAVKLWGDLLASDEAYERALGLARELGDQKLIAKVKINSAKNKTRVGNHPEAIRQLEEVIRICKEIDCGEILARAYADIGLIYSTQGNYPVALEYYFSSLEINEKRNDYVGTFDNLICIASVQSSQEDFDAALGTIQRARRESTQKRDSMRISRCLNLLGNIHRQLHHPEAFVFFQNSLQMSRFNKPEQNIDNLINIGLLQTDSGHFEAAEKSLGEALALAQKMKMKRVLGTVYEKIGILNFKLKRYVSAKESVQTALALAVETHSSNLQRDCHKILSEIFAATGDFRNAYRSHTQYKLLYDSITNEKSTRKIALLESSYRFAKEREVYELEKTSRELRIRNQQQTILSLVMTSLLVLLLAIAAYWSGRLRKKVLGLKIEQINRELEANQKAMAVAKLKLIQNSEREVHHVKMLEDIRESTNGIDEALGALISDYKFQANQSSWEEFETLFTKVNSSFWDKLNDRYPTLTPNERKLCVFLKLNMSNKDIALITFQSEEALKKSRLRLRKKFDLDRSTNLVAFIQNL